MSSWRRLLTIMTVVLAMCFFTGPVRADEAEPEKSPRHRAGAFITGGASYDGSSDYDFYSINPFWGVFLSDPGPGRVWSTEFALEGFYNRYVDDFSSNYELGFSPTFRFHYGFEESWSPYLEASVGILYTDLDTPEQGTEVNYDVHVGGGLNFRIRQDLYLTAGYRLRHISNAGMSDRNKGIDYNQLIFGLSYYY
ncbi:MAG: acyloxyacyl hydrolase [Proteobacteria bacterium]|nr:acyloxyacyl hydrolase [Pseudomonadota bacterium]